MFAQAGAIDKGRSGGNDQHELLTDELYDLLPLIAVARQPQQQLVDALVVVIIDKFFLPRQVQAVPEELIAEHRRHTKTRYRLQQPDTLYDRILLMPECIRKLIQDG